MATREEVENWVKDVAMGPEWTSELAAAERASQIAARKARAAEFRKTKPRRKYEDL